MSGDNVVHDVNGWCPQCGPVRSIDEDGCCKTCGCDASGEGAERAIQALELVAACCDMVEDDDVALVAQGDASDDYANDVWNRLVAMARPLRGAFIRTLRMRP